MTIEEVMVCFTREWYHKI